MLAALALALLGSWSFAGLGLLCASRAQNSETANGLINLMTLPMIMLSGVFFSSSRFPGFLQPVIRLLPLSAFNEALRHVVNDGASIFIAGLPDRRCWSAGAWYRLGWRCVCSAGPEPVSATTTRFGPRDRASCRACSATASS